MIERLLASVFALLAVLFSPAANALDDWQPLPTGTVTRIAFGSCAKQWEPQPIWDAVAAAKPNLFLFIGDAIYGDFHGDKPFTPTAESLKTDWDRLATIPEFTAVRKQVPFMVTWDNHDYGSHNGGAEFALKDMTKQQFLDFFGESEDATRRRTPGIYDAKIFGPPGKRVQVILLDTRYFKGPFVKDTRSKSEKKAAGLSGSMGNYVPNKDLNVTLLGEAQWQWLEAQLKKPAEIRLIGSSTQVVADQKAMDEWGNYPLERQRLFNLIDKTGANGVVLLSGNVHFAEISKLETDAYPLLDFTSSGMTHNNEAYAKAVNSYRVVGPFAGLNFGLVEIDWDASPEPKITLKAIGADGSTAFEHQVSLGSLSSTEQIENSKGGKMLKRCPEPRPQICTREYRPVCAQQSDGTIKSYATGCTACSDPTVTAFREGTCE